MISVIKWFRKRSDCSRALYLADYSSDIENLPTSESKGTQGAEGLSVNSKCSPGSICLVAENSSVWILNNQNQWIEQSGGSGSSSDAASSEEVLALFGWNGEEE